MKRKRDRCAGTILAFLLIILLSWISTSAAATEGAPVRDQRISRQQAIEKTLDLAGVKPGMIIGEVGAAEGYFTTFLLERMGDSGKVYANDIDSDSLEILRKRNLENVEIVLGETDDPGFPVHDLDLVIMRSVFHDLENPISMMENIKNYLKPAAPLVIVELHAKDPIDQVSLPMHVLTKDEFLAIVLQSSYKMAAPVEIPGFWSVYVFKADKNREKTVWSDWLGRFHADVKEVQESEKNENVSACKKQIAWERLLNTYRENSPETTEDTKLREYIKERIAALSEDTHRYRSIDQDDIEDILEGLGFGARFRIRVRSGDFPNQFEKMSPEGDPVVKDDASGLMWHPSGSQEALDFFSAQAWIDDLNIGDYAGYSDWRLPTAEEAASLIEADKRDGGLHIDPIFSEVQYIIWTGNSYYPGRSWLVEYTRAGFIDDLKIHVGWVRPVRSSFGNIFSGCIQRVGGSSTSDFFQNLHSDHVAATEHGSESTTGLCPGGCEIEVFDQ